MSNSDYKPYVGDLKTVIEVDMQEDLTNWTNMKFFVKKPKVGGGTEIIEWTAAQKAGVGNEDIMTYTTHAVTSEWDIGGEYYIQPYGENGSGWKGRGDTVNQMVYDLYK